MNYEQANSVKELASPVMKVLERLEITPILEWETIERVIKKAGYGIEFIQSDASEWRAHILSDFDHRDILNADYCKTRQLAVMKAVIELGKEMK